MSFKALEFKAQGIHLENRNYHPRWYVAAMPLFAALGKEANASLIAAAPKPKSSGKGWEYCPSCGGVLDTGWECLSCKADWRGFAAFHPGIEQAPKAAPEATTLLFSNEKDVQS